MTRRQPAGWEVRRDHRCARRAHQLDQRRALARGPCGSPPAPPPPRVRGLVKERYERNVSVPQRRQRGVNEQRNAAVGVIEDGVVKDDYSWPALLELGAQLSRPAADLG